MDGIASAVEFRDVTFQRASGRTILSGVSFTVMKGESFALIGRSGSGKTTILKLINRLLDPSAGDVLVDGESTRQWDPIRLRRRIGYVLQDIGLFPHLPIGANVGIIPALEGWESRRIDTRVNEVLHMVGLEPGDFINRYPHELSGGQRQRVGVARALAADPPLLLMDEPFGALDPSTRLHMQELLVTLWREAQATVFFVTHSIEEAVYLGDRTYVFSSAPGTILKELAVPPPDFPAKEMQRQPEFMEIVFSIRDIVESLESSTRAGDE
jgi:osmoprotectant transport system ATP-binding protein